VSEAPASISSFIQILQCVLVKYNRPTTFTAYTIVIPSAIDGIRMNRFYDAKLYDLQW